MDEIIREQLANNVVVLYMKGTPELPQCGFSFRTVEALQECGVAYHSANVLENQALREAVKAFSNWPTFPQLYVKGELIGGCDIIIQLHEQGELKKRLEAASQGA